MPGRIFVDEPEEEYQVRLEAQRQYLINTGHDLEKEPWLAEMMLECADELDAQIFQDLAWAAESERQKCK
jgi:hypothetical protein